MVLLSIPKVSSPQNTIAKLVMQASGEISRKEERFRGKLNKQVKGNQTLKYITRFQFIWTPKENKLIKIHLTLFITKLSGRCLNKIINVVLKQNMKTKK